MAQTSMQKLIDAGVQFGVTTRKQAKATVKQLVKDGELRRKEAADYVDALVERSREATERMNAAVQEEVSKLTAGFHERMAEMESQIQSLIAQIPGVGHDAPASKSAANKDATAAATKAPAKKATGTQTVAGVTSAKKAAAKTTTSKTTTSKTAGVKKAVAKKAVAKKAVAKTPAKKAVAKASTAKTSAPKKASPKKATSAAGTRGASTSRSS